MVRYAAHGALLLSLVTVYHRYILAANQFILATDTGTLALMAQNILKGERPLFLYGFSYSGAPLAYLTALSFRLGGASLASLIWPVALLAGLWVWFTFLLVRRLAGPRAALAAALLATFADRTTSWYTHTPDTSYSALLLFGTAILWLALEISYHEWRGLRLMLALTLLGALAGVALWTNAIIAPLLLVATLPLAGLLWRQRCHPLTLAAFLLALLAFLATASPLLPMLQRTSHGATLTWQLSPNIIWHNLKLMLDQTLSHFFIWRYNSHFDLIFGRIFTLAALLVGLTTWYRARRQTLRHSATLLPLCGILFLLFYLPHAMAREVVPRYLLPLWSSFIIASLALPQGSGSPRLRRAATLLTLIWCCWNLQGMVALLPAGQRDRHQRLARREEITATANRLGARHVTLLGHYLFQAEANGLTFLANGKAIYTAANRERYLPHAQSAERDPKRIYLCHPAALAPTRASLSSLNATWSEYNVDEMATLIYNIQPAHQPRQLVESGHYSITFAAASTNSPAVLRDASPATYITAPRTSPATLAIDLHTQRHLCSLDLLPATADGLNLPTSLALEGSCDGTNYLPLITAQQHLPIAYQAGPAIYLGGGQGRATLNFPPTPLRHLRLHLALPGDSPLAYAGEAEKLKPEERCWSLASFRLFEAAPPGKRPALEEELRDIRQLLAEMEVCFTACDRWLAPRIAPVAESFESATTFPYFENPTALLGDDRGLSFMRIATQPNLAVVVASELADLQQEILGRCLGGGDPWWRTDHGRYTSFILLPAAHYPELTWDGSLLAP